LIKLKETAYQWVDENEKKIIEWSDTVWGYAELGLLEYKTSKYLSDITEKAGFKVDRGVAEMPTAFMGTWSNGPGPTIGILGELDALAGISQKAVPYKEPIKEGAPGHGCGHNIYGSGAVAAAIALKTRRLLWVRYGWSGTGYSMGLTPFLRITRGAQIQLVLAAATP
jgi:aminobenzoyl-glutamate utilization protein B